MSGGIHGGHYKTTFLTIIKDKGASLNAIYYPVNHNDIQGTDQRESGYCRVKVSAKNIIPLGLTILPEGSYWAYAQKNNDIEKPNKEYPLAQSYIDVFLDGCINTPG